MDIFFEREIFFLESYIYPSSTKEYQHPQNLHHYIINVCWIPFSCLLWQRFTTVIMAIIQIFDVARGAFSTK
jgi:hypothetical protein